MDAYPTTADIIGDFHSKAAVASDLAPAEFELVGIARIGNERLEVPVESIEYIEPDEQPGMVVMHLKQEMLEHRTTLIVTAATLLALGAFALKRRQSHS